MWKLHCKNAICLKRNLDATDKVSQLWHVGEHVVTDQQIRLLSFLFELVGNIAVKESHARRDALLLGGRRYVSGGFNAEDRNPSFIEILKEVTVVTCDLDNETVLIKP